MPSPRGGDKKRCAPHWAEHIRANDGTGTLPAVSGMRRMAVILFHPDCDRRPRDRTGSAPLGGSWARATRLRAHHHRWGLAPRPENACKIGAAPGKVNSPQVRNSANRPGERTGRAPAAFCRRRPAPMRQTAAPCPLSLLFFRETRGRDFTARPKFASMRRACFKPMLLPEF